MPVVANQPAPPPPPPPPVPSEWPRKRITWTGCDGAQFVLTDIDAGFYPLVGRKGFGMPTRDFITDDMPDAGVIPRGVRDEPALIGSPLKLRADTPQDFLPLRRAFVRSLRAKLNGKLTPGTLTVQLGDGTSRWTRAYYQAGLDGLESLDRCSETYPDLSFLAPWPYWRAAPQQLPLAFPAATGFFPFLPLRLTPTSTFGALTVTLADTDSDTWPVWTITGPGTPTLVNNSTGQQLVFSTAIPAGRTVTIDTRPVTAEPVTGKTVLDNTGVNWWGNLTRYPSLWPLQPGENDISVTVASATSATSVLLTYEPTYETAW